MQFSVARPDVVRAINQRWLLKRWERRLGTNRAPHWKTMEADDLSHMVTNLSFLDVSRDGGTARFLVRFHGETIGQVYGSSDCRGKYLDEIIPAARRAESLAPYHWTLGSGCPVYTVHDVSDRDGRIVHYERLLLPYAGDKQNIDHILASLEFICADGAFNSRELMKSPAAPPMLRLSATIKPQTLV